MSTQTSNDGEHAAAADVPLPPSPFSSSSSQKPEPDRLQRPVYTSKFTVDFDGPILNPLDPNKPDRNLPRAPSGHGLLRYKEGKGVRVLAEDEWAARMRDSQRSLSHGEEQGGENPFATPNSSVVGFERHGLDSGEGGRDNPFGDQHEIHTPTQSNVGSAESSRMQGRDLGAIGKGKAKDRFAKASGDLRKVAGIRNAERAAGDRDLDIPQPFLERKSRRALTSIGFLSFVSVAVVATVMGTSYGLEHKLNPSYRVPWYFTVWLVISISVLLLCGGLLSYDYRSTSPRPPRTDDLEARVGGAANSRFKMTPIRNPAPTTVPLGPSPAPSSFIAELPDTCVPEAGVQAMKGPGEDTPQLFSNNGWKRDSEIARPVPGTGENAFGRILSWASSAGSKRGSGSTDGAGGGSKRNSKNLDNRSDAGSETSSLKRAASFTKAFIPNFSRKLPSRTWPKEKPRSSVDDSGVSNSAPVDDRFIVGTHSDDDEEEHEQLRSISPMPEAEEHPDNYQIRGDIFQERAGPALAAMERRLKGKTLSPVNEVSSQSSQKEEERWVAVPINQPSADMGDSTIIPSVSRDMPREDEVGRAARAETYYGDHVRGSEEEFSDHGPYMSGGTGEQSDDDTSSDEEADDQGRGSGRDSDHPSSFHNFESDSESESDNEVSDAESLAVSQTAPESQRASSNAEESQEESENGDTQVSSSGSENEEEDEEKAEDVDTQSASSDSETEEDDGNEAKDTDAQSFSSDGETEEDNDDEPNNTDAQSISSDSQNEEGYEGEHGTDATQSVSSESENEEDHQIDSEADGTQTISQINTSDEEREHAAYIHTSESFGGVVDEILDQIPSSDEEHESTSHYQATVESDGESDVDEHQDDVLDRETQGN